MPAKNDSPSPPVQKLSLPARIMEWAPAINYLVGILSVVGFFIFWGLTDRTEPFLLGVAGTMAGLGMTAEFGRDVARKAREPKE